MVDPLTALVVASVLLVLPIVLFWPGWDSPGAGDEASLRRIASGSKTPSSTSGTASIASCR